MCVVLRKGQGLPANPRHMLVVSWAKSFFQEIRLLPGRDASGEARLYKERLMLWPQIKFVRFCKLKCSAFPRRMPNIRGTVTAFSEIGHLRKLYLAIVLYKQGKTTVQKTVLVFRNLGKVARLQPKNSYGQTLHMCARTSEETML